jgi:hypothetical protein
LVRARMTLPREALTSLTRIMLVARLPAWKARSAACLIISSRHRPTEITFDADVVAGELVVRLDHGIATIGRARRRRASDLRGPRASDRSTRYRRRCRLRRRRRTGRRRRKPVRSIPRGRGRGRSCRRGTARFAGRVTTRLVPGGRGVSPHTNGGCASGRLATSVSPAR